MFLGTHGTHANGATALHKKFDSTHSSIFLGAFRVEMQRESQKDRTILCKYEPTEPGDYRIEVKWSGEHVPGSPFMVMIFDTQEELSRFLQVNLSAQKFSLT